MRSSNWISTSMLVATIAGTAAAQKPAPKPAAPAPAPAAAPAAGQGGMIAGGVVGAVAQWKGVVFAVNHQTRHVVVIGPNGNQHGFYVDKRITTFDNVNKGDTVTVDYVESVGVFLRKPGDPPAAGASNTMTVTPTGKPAVTDVTVKEVTVDVTAVDQATRALTVKGPAGNTQTYIVDPSVKAFSSVKVGDQIVVRYTEAVAVAVTK